MSRGRRIVLFLSLALVAAVVGYYLARPKEPEYQGKPLSYWLDRRKVSYLGLKELDEVRKAFKGMGTNAVPDLIRKLGGKDSSLKSAYSKFIAILPDKVAERLSFLQVRDQRAAGALGILGPDAAPAIPALIEKLGDFPLTAGSRSPFVDALAEIGPQAALPLGKALLRSEADIREGAFQALELLGTNAMEAVPEIMRFIAQAGDDEVRSQAIGLLASAKCPPETAVPFLMNCLDDKAAKVREMAVYALGKREAAAIAATPKLIWMFGNDLPVISERAAASIGMIGGDASAVIPTLVEQLGHQVLSGHGPSGFEWALIAQGALSAGSTGAVLLRDDAAARWGALKVLRYLETNAVVALPDIYRLIERSTNQLERAVAVTTIGFIRGPSESAVPFLLVCLADPDSKVRESAAFALGEYGTRAKGAIARLSWMVQSDTPACVEQAENALRQIDPEAVAKTVAERQSGVLQWPSTPYDIRNY